MTRTGYDSFYTEPDSQEKINCKICGTQCVVERSVIGPTGWAEAMGKRGHWHDKFYCPYRNESWHKQALEILLEIEKTPSKRISEVLRLDLDDILRENNCID